MISLAWDFILFSETLRPYMYFRFQQVLTEYGWRYICDFDSMIDGIVYCLQIRTYHKEEERL